jgi:TetR/AcrR family transcriptional regulator, regulator of autoinduction and epiphytic fitness
MARNKRDIDADVKRDEIVSSALALFQAHGFDGTSMAMISRDTGIAPNTIYWYFAGKEELLLGVLGKVAPLLAAEYQHKHFRSAAQRLSWLMGKLSEYQPLIDAVHARLAHSPAIRDWHDRYHQVLEALITTHLEKEGMAAERAQLMATIGTFVVEGLMSHPHSAAQRKAILAWLAGSEGSASGA